MQSISIYQNIHNSEIFIFVEKDGQSKNANHAIRNKMYSVVNKDPNHMTLVLKD